MNITADATTPGGLGTLRAWTTRACRRGASRSSSEGVLRGFLTLARDGGADRRGRGGSMRAEGWSRMPLVRMTNLHLEPGEGSLEELIAGVDAGVYLETNKSWSIDDKRLNFQFGTQIAWEIKDGKLGRMLRDATYTGITPRVLGLAGRRRRAGGVAPVRPDELRQGPAGPARARLARRRRRRASATSRSASARDDALELAERALAAAEGDEAEVVVQSERSGLARFAGSEVHQPTLIDNTVGDDPHRARRRVGVAATQPDERRAACARSRAARRRAPTARRADPHFPGLAPPAEVPAVDGLRRGDRRARRRTTWRGSRRAAIDAAGDLGVYGFVTSGDDRDRDRVDDRASASRSALTDAHGARRSPRATAAPGYADASAGRSGDLDPAAVAARGGGEGGPHARRRRDRARAVPRGARAVRARGAAPVLRATTRSAALGLLEERSFFSGRIGERVFDERVSIADDALDPRGLPKAFDFEGVPKQRVALVGTASREASSGTARPRRAPATGTSRPATRRRAPGGRTGRCRSRSRSRGGEAESIEELAELVGDGIYVTRLHYLNIVEPREGVDHRDDARRHVPDPRRQDRGAARQPALHGRRAGDAADVPGLTRDAPLVKAERLLRRALPDRALVPAIATARFNITGVGSTPGL